MGDLDDLPMVWWDFGMFEKGNNLANEHCATKVGGPKTKRVLFLYILGGSRCLPIASV
jgi:hypothetical protein